MNPADSWLYPEDKMTGIYSLTASISMTRRSQSTQWQTLDANKTCSQKYTWGSDGIVLQCVKNDNLGRHLPTSSYSERVAAQNFLAIFLLEDVPRMLYRVLTNPCLYILWWPFHRVEMLSETISLSSGLGREDPQRERLPQSSSSLSTKIRARN